MKIAIGFSGAAGTGVNTSGLLLGELLSAKGYTVLGDKEYASIIKGDNNDFFLYISDASPFITKKIDHFFPFDDYAITKNEQLYILKKIHKLKKSTVMYKNVYFFGASLKLLGIPCEEGERLLAKYFSDDILSANIQCLRTGYGYFSSSQYNLSQNIGQSKSFMFGNEVVGKGAIAHGMNFYAAYPMTPASSLIDVIVPFCHHEHGEGYRGSLDSSTGSEGHRTFPPCHPEHSEGYKGGLDSSTGSEGPCTFFQGEDEIAVSMAMLGAKFAGKRAMCGSSGGGFALMSESLSFSHMAELGGVYILSQRDGPSTGTPTYTGQSDLTYALHASFGDTFPIVLAPSTFEEGYSLIGKALNWSDIYQHPVIFLLDKQFSESYLSLDPATFVHLPEMRGKLLTQGSDTYKRYETTADGISPVMLPGTEHGEFIATSYEHDESGATTEDPVIKKQQQDKRCKKLDTFVQQEFIQDFYGYEIINPEASQFFVTFGVNRYVVEEYMRQRNGKLKIKNGKLKYGLIVMKVFQPFDMRLKEFLDTHVKQIKKLIFVEMNTSGQLQELITNTCWLHDKKWNNKITNIRKYTLYPIFAEDLLLR